MNHNEYIPHLVGKFYFNTKSGAAWKFVSQDGDRLQCLSIRIPKKWERYGAQWQPGVTVQSFQWSELTGISRYTHNWIVVDDLKAAIVLYSPNDEEMIEAEY